jgi:hypothetical protein
MTSRLSLGFFVALFGCAIFAPGSAAAATEIGMDCTPNFWSLQSMVMQSKRSTPPGAVQTAAPGIVTSWRVRTSAPDSGSAELKVLRQVGDEFEVTAESAAGTLLPSRLNVFPTRIPVPAGVSFGLAADDPPGCEIGSDFGNVVLEFETAPSVGGTTKATGSQLPAFVPLMVVIEPDADNDGFGDETQDQCPQSAATQGACPPPPVGPASATVKLKGKPKLEGNVVAVKLTTSVAAKLTATGSIRGKRAAKPVSKTIKPGETGRLYLSLKKSVKQRLANLPRKRKLRMVVEVKATGAPTVSAEISLPGRKKPQASPRR